MRRPVSADLVLFSVTWRDKSSKKTFTRSFRHKKRAQEFAQIVGPENDVKALVEKGKYDCRFIWEQGVEDMYRHYEIVDWSLPEFEAYVEERKDL